MTAKRDIEKLSGELDAAWGACLVAIVFVAGLAGLAALVTFGALFFKFVRWLFT